MWIMNAVFLSEAKKLESKLIADRRYLHEHGETGFELGRTGQFVTEELQKMGYEPQPCGKAGIVALAGGKKPGKVFLLRADMDALPIREQTDDPYAAKNGKMHACGHDLHTAMLLGAARILKDHEDEICGTVKLMFQPAEEIFEGSRDMIGAGVLENPKVDAAMMIHVIAAMPHPEGTVCVAAPGVSLSAADFFSIQVQGKGCHGSMPQQGVDPLNAAAHILIALQEIHSRELASDDQAILTIGKLHGGTAANIIPDTVVMEGTLRTYDDEIRGFMKKRITEITESIAKAFRAEARTEFGRGTPSLLNDAELAGCVGAYGKELLGETGVIQRDGSEKKSTASDDFAYISREVPSIMVEIAAGHPEHGYSYPQHHPKVRFDENIMPGGSAVYAYTALRWLEEHC